MRSTALVLTICCLMVAACGKAAPRADRPAEPASTAPAGDAQPAAAPAPVPVEPRPARARRGDPTPTTPVAAPVAPTPVLPAVVDRSTTPDQLAAHALVVAREEVAANATNGYGVLDRQAQLIAAWTPLLTEYHANLAAVRAERDQRSAYRVREAERLAANDARLRAMEAEYDRKATIERAKTAPIEPQ